MNNSYGDYNNDTQQMRSLEVMAKFLIKEQSLEPDEIIKRLSEEQFSERMLLKRISKN